MVGAGGHPGISGCLRENSWLGERGWGSVAGAAVRRGGGTSLGPSSPGVGEKEMGPKGDTRPGSGPHQSSMTFTATLPGTLRM